MSEEIGDWEDDDDRCSELSKRDSPNLTSLDFWDYSVELECLKSPEDLQLAAELGKTLLERNKELETNLKDYQRLIDDQAKEIEYLTKQAAALRKTNDNRIRIYEHLEVSIQELERANQKLALDNSADKKQIKSLCAYRDTLESRCEELQKALEDSRAQQQVQKEQMRKLLSSKEKDGSLETQKKIAVSQTSIEQTPVEEDLINQLTKQNQELKIQISKDQRKIADLEEEMSRKIQDMTLLTEELHERELQVTSLRSKVSDLEDVRSENFCDRCCREIDLNGPHQLFLPEEFTEEEQHSGSFHLEDKEDNPYRNLVEMYQSLAKSNWENRQRDSKNGPVSLIDELQPFLNNNQPEEEEELPGKGKRRTIVKGNAFPTAGTDYSEEETSSGFSDETCNKSTQTERNLIPGSFLCSIADGDDCKFSIYDDACPIESRFRKTPEHRALFREIFAVLKRAAEAKSNGEQLPLLDDLTPVSETPKVPPVTPASEEPPVDFEDTQSLAESVSVSEAASETSSAINEKPEESLKDLTQETPGPSATTTKDIRRTNDILEYISVSVAVKKKSKRKSVDSPARRAEGVDKAETSSPNSPRKSGGRRRKEWRNYDILRPDSRTQSPAVQPHILTTLTRKDSPETKSSWSFQPFVSTAAQEVAKLKKLDKSYAEVLRLTPKTFVRPRNVRLTS